MTKISGFQRKELTYSILSMLPATLLFSTVVIIPLLLNFVFAFTNYNGLNPNFAYIGFDNFIKVVSDRLFLEAVGRTLVYALYCISMGILLQLILALILYNGVPFSSFLKAVFYTPAMLSMVIVSISWKSILRYGGVLNKILTDFNLGQYALDWLGDVSLTLISIAIITQWVYIGHGAILILGGLNSIPKEIMEAAELDGARGMRKFFSITLPLIMQSITVLLFLHNTGSLTMFVIPFVMTNGGPRHSTELISLNIYNNAFVYGRVGYATAGALVFLVLVAIVGIIQLKITRKREVEY
jgi:raffinose/stachyose/melibiose transport system permease protein